MSEPTVWDWNDMQERLDAVRAAGVRDRFSIGQEQFELVIARGRQLEKEVEGYRIESEAHARIVGMSGERELRLRAEVESLRRKLNMAIRLAGTSEMARDASWSNALKGCEPEEMNR